MSAFIDDYLPSDSINLVGLNLACGGNYTIFKQAGKIVHPLDLLKEEMLRMAQKGDKYIFESYILCNHIKFNIKEH